MNSCVGISDQALELSPGKNFLIFFQIQRIEQNPIIWKRSHQLFQAIKALELLPAWSCFEDWWLVMPPITARQSVGWTPSAHSVFTAPTFIFRWSKCDYPKTTKHQSRFLRSWISVRRQSIECVNQANCLAIALEAGGVSMKKRSCWWKIQTWCYSSLSKAWRRLVGE